MGGKTFKEFVDSFIVVKVEGLNPERFINLCSHQGVVLWEISRLNFTTIQCRMKYNQYRQVKDIVKKSGCKIKIVKKYGLHFVFNKANRRKFFFAGIFLFLAALLYFSSIVWKVEIYGNKTIATQKIYTALKKAGLSEGKLKFNMKLREIENKTTKEIDEISMVNIRFVGTYAMVEVIERTMPPKMIDFDKPVNIVAKRDAQIIKIDVLKGKALAAQDEIVKKGQVLISGIITDKNNAPLSIVHAMGEVLAKTWYEQIEEVPLDYTYEERTGKVKEKTYLVVMGKKIYLKNNTINFKKYDKIEEKSMVSVKGIEFPVEKVTEYYFEKIDANKLLTYDEAVNIALQKCQDKLKNEMPVNIKIIDKIVEKENGNRKVKVRLLYVTEEKIGEEQEIK